MPATDLGLADVDQRLHALCRRLNIVTMLHAGSIWVATVVALLALRFVVGASRVGGSPWVLGGIVSLGVAAWGIVYVRRHWVTPAAAALRADREGDLHERVTTLLELGEVGQGRVLLPVLLAQTLELGERWRAETLVPRAYPRTIYLALVAFLVLLTSPLLEPDAPESQKSPTPPAALSNPASDSNPVPDLPLQLAANSGEGDGAAGDEVDQEAGAPGDPSDGSKGKKGTGQTQSAKQSKVAGGASAKLPSGAPLPETAGKPTGARTPSAGSPDDSSDSAKGETQSGDRKGEPGDDRSGKPNDRPDGQPPKDQIGKIDAKIPPNSQAGAPPVSATAQAASMKQSAKDEAKGGKDKKNDDSKGNGSSPGAGAGSERGNLLTVRGKDADANGATTGTFKLTLSSFLNNAAQRPDDDPKQQSDKAIASRDERSDHALDQRQLDDDALRKTSVPPEYEDVVKRVYSRN